MSRCGPNKITLLVGAPKHDQRTMCVPAVRTNRYMMAGRLAAGAAAAVASSSAAASDMAVGSVYIIYIYWGRVLEQHVLPHGRAPTAPDGANFQTEKWTVFQVQQLHPSKYIDITWVLETRSHFRGVSQDGQGLRAVQQVGLPHGFLHGPGARDGGQGQPGPSRPEMDEHGTHGT